MTNNTESVGKTPRTDAIFRDLYGRKIEAHEAIQIATEWAEQLETELSVLTERIAGLEAENKVHRRQAAIEGWHEDATFEPEVDEVMDEFNLEIGSIAHEVVQLRLALSRANAAMEEWDDFIERVNQWAKAYPTDIFPEVTTEQWKQIADMLDKAGLPALDRISASNMRHVITNIKREMDNARAK